MIFDEFVELHGDRAFGDDRAIRTGFARLGDFKVMLIGHQKGHTLKERQRVLLRLRPPGGLSQGAEQDAAGRQVQAAGRLPDRHAGAYSGDRGGGARPGPAHRHEHSRDVPAADAGHLRRDRGRRIGRGTGHRRRRPGGMLEHAYYSVISPEGCAGILLEGRPPTKRNPGGGGAASDRQTCSKLGVIDDIIPEPLGGAHRDPRDNGEDTEKLPGPHSELRRAGSRTGCWKNATTSSAHGNPC